MKATPFDHTAHGQTMGQGERLTAFCRRCWETIPPPPPPLYGRSECGCRSAWVSIIHSANHTQARRTGGVFGHRVERVGVVEETRNAA